MLKFSVIVPVYNVEHYIAECIESVLKQTYLNYELILVVDGSPDRSGDICFKYAARDDRVKVFSIENNGALHARVFGMEIASGDFYIFLDSDDTLKKNAFEVVAKAIEKYKCDTVIFGYERVCDGRIVSQCSVSKEECLEKKAKIYKKVFFDLDYNSLCRKAVRSDVFKGLDYSPYYHINMAEDLLQSIEIYKNSNTVAFISDILYEYRMNPYSVTHTNRITTIDFTIRKKVLEFLQSEHVFSKEDFDQYRDFCIGLLVSTLKTIGTMSIPIAQKKDLFLQIRHDDYYKEFLSKGIADRKPFGFKAAVYDLFQIKQDTLLLTILSIYGKIKQ